ncbi:MAG: hypothetical protein ACJAXY_000411 [Nonlabens sp.]|jgi:hypothetical protein
MIKENYLFKTFFSHTRSTDLPPQLENDHHQVYVLHPSKVYCQLIIYYYQFLNMLPKNLEILLPQLHFFLIPQNLEFVL